MILAWWLLMLCTWTGPAGGERFCPDGPLLCVVVDRWAADLNADGLIDLRDFALLQNMTP